MKIDDIRRLEESLWRDGVLEKPNRSSIWGRIDGAWRLRFHQATPVAG
ncbi:MAG: hypothetical protein AAGD47_07420 [Pseudomonadota bacterium]